MLGRSEGQWFGNSLGEREGHKPKFKSSGMSSMKETIVNTLEPCRESCTLRGEPGFSFSKKGTGMFRRFGI